MEEQLISFETAKLAKEKGYLTHSDVFYQHDGSFSICHKHSKRANDCRDVNSSECYAPTQSLLQKWLREKHNIHIIIIPCDDKTVWIYTLETINPTEEYGCPNRIDFNTFEEALEDALFQSLNLTKY